VTVYLIRTFEWLRSWFALVDAHFQLSRLMSRRLCRTSQQNPTSAPFVFYKDSRWTSDFYRRVHVRHNIACQRNLCMTELPQLFSSRAVSERLRRTDSVYEMSPKTSLKEADAETGRQNGSAQCRSLTSVIASWWVQLYRLLFYRSAPTPGTPLPESAETAIFKGIRQIGWDRVMVRLLCVVVENFIRHAKTQSTHLLVLIPLQFIGDEYVA